MMLLFLILESFVFISTVLEKYMQSKSGFLIQIPFGVTIAGFKNLNRKNPPIREAILVSDTFGYFSYKEAKRKNKERNNKCIHLTQMQSPFWSNYH